MQAGWVYFIACPEYESIKIGWTTTHPVHRLEQCQTGCPVELELVLAIPAEKRLEKELHRLFSEDRGIGEWFHWTPEMWRYMSSQADAHRDDALGYLPGWLASAEQHRINHERKVAYLARLAEKAATANP